MSKKDYRVRNWKDYNEALVKRGSITFWFDEESLAKWYSERKVGRGRPEKYSDIAIHCGLTLKALLGLTLRSTEGFLESLVELMKLELEVPDYTSLCKRQKTLDIKLPQMKKKCEEKLDIVIDTTGLKIYGEGEWRVRTHGKTQRRRWRKVHLAINSKTQEIEACCLTDQKIQDCEGLPLLLNQIKKPLHKVIADGAYDRFSCYEEVEKKKGEGVFPPQHNASTSKKRPENKKKGSKEAVLKRDKAIEEVERLGRKGWKIKTGYHKRSLAETGMFRLKTLLGDRLSARCLENQRVELNVRCFIINKMTALGMPQTVAI